MDYEAFKTEFMTELRDAGLLLVGLSPDETLEMRTTARRFSVHILPVRPERASPLHVAGTISWTWDAIKSARTATCEGDLLQELLGSREAREVPTAPPDLRVDLTLSANFLWGQEIPMPPPSTWVRWGREAVGRMRDVERVVTEETEAPLEGGLPSVLAWQGEPTLQVLCNEQGELRLESLSLDAFQMIDLPRNTDDTDAEPDPHPASQLAAMFARVRAALHAWGEVMDHLVKMPEAPKA